MNTTAITDQYGDVERLLDGLARHLDEIDREALKDAVAGLVGRIVLDPETLRCRIEYAIPTGELLASPRGFEPLYPP